MSLKRGISGYICVRNAVSLDYCIREAAISMIPAVDELVICDGESTDETRSILLDLERADSRVRVITYPWPNPHQDDRFWVKWLNFARGHLRYDMQLELDADEVLDPDCYSEVRAVAAKKRSALFRRLNFWKDAQHLAPHNRCCGTMVARLCPTELYMPSDEQFPAESPNARTEAEEYPRLRIFHYGFLRNPSAFVRKSKEVQNMFFGSCDPRIEEMEKQGKRWDDRNYFDLPLQNYVGNHPRIAHAWLKERGYMP